MAKTAFDRDNVLNPEERTLAACKCLALLIGETERMTEKEAEFVSDMEIKVEHFGCSERQLAWLRDLTEKYCQ